MSNEEALAADRRDAQRLLAADTSSGGGQPDHPLHSVSQIDIALPSDATKAAVAAKVKDDAPPPTNSGGVGATAGTGGAAASVAGGAGASAAAASSESGFSTEVAGIMFFNFISSTGIVSANKYVFRTVGFTFATTLTLVHFIVTTMGLALFAKLGFFTVKRLDVRKAAALAAAGMGFVVFSNLSLQYNSVGFYQVMKHLTVAAVVVIEALVYKRVLPRPLWGSIACLCIGIAITGATDFQLNLVGTIFACLNVLCTAMYQIWTGSLQRSLAANPLQLQMYIAPLSAVMILPFVPLLDDYNPASPASIWHFELTSSAAVAIALTGVLAFCVNVSIFWVIGRTSAVTYNVLGHAKTSTLLLVDFIFFGRPVEWKNMAGLGIAITGVVSYTQTKLRLSQPAKAAGGGSSS
ncbi:hypothetical protein MMPV_006488 [Pyropia vietnamensis]